MGIKESNPEIIGKSISVKGKEEKNFFNRTHLIFKSNNFNNKYSDYNLLKSLEIKSFIVGNKKPERKDLRDYTWVEYLIIHITNLKDKYHGSWANDLLKILKEKNITIPENKYYSDVFFHEYQIKTIPNSLIQTNDIIENDSTSNYGDICCTLYNTELTLINDKNFCQLDLLDNLGGSYLEFNNDLLPEDPTYQYQLRRNNVKKYMKLFKDNIYNNVDHPINQIICFFNQLFSKYIEDRIKELQNQLKKDIINQEKFNELIKVLENEITNSLQEFITRIHSAVKLFYSYSVDFIFLEEEKDDLINLITSFIFKTGKLYDSILDLYSYSFKEEFENFQSKLIELKNIKPNKLGIAIKFCLDENTIKLQNKLRKRKNKKESNEKDDNENEEEEEENEEKNKNSNSEKKMKKANIFQKLKEDNKLNNLHIIKEKEEDKDENINIVEGSKNKEGTGQLVFYLTEENELNNKNNNKENKYKNILNDYNMPIRSKTKLSNSIKEDDYLLERLSFLEDSKNEMYYNSLNQLRNSINNFNNKIYFFPKLYKQLKNITMIENNNYKFSTIMNNKEKSLPIPYLSAINLLKSIKKFKTPFEKIVIIAAISDQIMENATSFWKDMEAYIDKDYLSIEADEIITIFLYIIIQSQMPEILLYCKMINNFTTQFTKSFNISYNYTLLEASIHYINDVKDITELYKKENGLLDASRTILDISTQRISRLSLGMG